MTPSAHLALLRAEYAYTPQSDDETSLEEDVLYYLLDDTDPDWFKVKLKASPTSGDPPQLGLVPANYVLPAEPIHSVTALYAYEAQTEDELTIQEDETLALYEEDGEWSLVGRFSQDNANRAVGYVPTTYIEAAQVEQEGPIPNDTLPSDQTSTSHSNQTSNNQEIETGSWSVTDIDRTKKKRKGTLVIDSQFLIFASESDKMGVQKYAMSTVSISKTEKGKHLILQCGSEERHFQVTENDLDEIVLKIQRVQQLSHSVVSSSSAAKTYASPLSTLSPALRPPSAMANPDRPPGTHGRKVSFAAPIGKPATALYDFEAQGDDELTVEEGDRLFVLDDTSDDDWWKCAKQADGEEGVVPASYIELDQGQPSGNQEAAHAAMTAAAAEDAKNRRIQEEEDARLAQRLAEEDSSAAQLENLKAADHKLSLAREAEQRKNAEAELAARQKKESEARRREAERAMIDPGFSNQPAPPKLTARPGFEHGDLPRRTDSVSQEERPKPQGHIRTWRDRTGQFKVEAEFRGLQNGKIRLHKVNGVMIEVPLTKMSNEDVIWLEGATGRTLRKQDLDDIPLANLSLGPSRPPARPASSEPPQRPRAPAKPPIDWFEFFLNAGCDLDDCTRYATNFEKDRIDENLLPDLESSTMRNLGLREGDVIRVRKHIKQKFGSNDESEAIAAQIQKDEELARKLQQSAAPAPNLFTNGPNGSLKTSRRGRPTPTRSGASLVDVNSLESAKDELIDAPQVGMSSSNNAPLISTSSPLAGGFDDDAWQVRPNSTAPTSAPPQSLPIRPTSAGAITTTSNASGDLKNTTETSKPSLNDEIFQKIMNHGKQNDAAPTQSTLAPASQPANPNPDGPRGPLAPVASNAPLLNPLVPLHTGMNTFIPTRSTGLLSQPTGFVPQNSAMAPLNNFNATSMTMQPTGVGMGMRMGNVNTSSFQSPGIQILQSQPTGMLPSHTVGMMQSQPIGMMQSQPTGMMQSQPTGMIQSQPNGMMQSQPTGMIASRMGGLTSQPTGINQMGLMQNQMTGFTTGFSPGLPPPVSSIHSVYSNSLQPPGSAPAKSFNPGDIFNQMKTGQFAQNSNSGPQDPNKYDALRPQQTGFVPSGSNFTQQFMPNTSQFQSPTGLQPLTAQPTGFAPGGYIVNQQTGMPPQNMFPNQNQSQQWRGF